MSGVAIGMAIGAVAAILAWRIAGMRRRSGPPRDAERELVVRLNATLLAELPVVDGLRLSASSQPADSGAAAGGDFYDAYFLDDETLAVAIGEADGFGVHAILAMECARTALRCAFLDGAGPVEALRRANAVLLRNEARAAVTVTTGIIDPATLQFRYACAGHAPPILAADGICAPLPGTDSGTPLGVDENHVSSEQVHTVPVDGLLALYTDGCATIDRDAGVARSILTDALADARKIAPIKPAQAIDRAIFGALPRPDDATILTITPEATLAHISLRLRAEPASAPHARLALRRFFAATPLGDRRAYDALVATGEAISNAIEHAYDGRSDGFFNVAARYEDDACVVRIEDGGTWRAAEPAAQSGRGLTLMRELSDACEIERRRYGTHVLLRFNFSGSLADVALGGAG